MKLLTSKSLLGIVAVGLLIIFSSSDVVGQRRGRRVSHSDKKCAKFVNCHDARDGRLDGRGPNRRDDGFRSIFRRNRRNRDRDFDNIGRRGRMRDRDWDDDRRWRRRR
jgi:hypothetical protein